MSALAPHAWGELVTLAAVILAVSVAILGGFRFTWKRTRPAAQAQSRRSHPAGRRRRVPGLERDGAPLTAFEERQLGRIDMESDIRIPEPVYREGER